MGSHAFYAAVCVAGLAAVACAQSTVPAGIYALGSAQDNPTTTQDERLLGIRDYDFVSGFTLRVFWRDLETAQSQYDFSVVDEAARRVEAIGKHVSIEVLNGEEPAYVLAGASATYTDHRGGINPVPWDPFLQQSFSSFICALANHIVNDGSGRNLRLNQHPAVASIDATPAGLNFGVRDLNNAIRSHPDYTQQRYIDAVINGVAVSRQAFPNQQGFLAFFGFNDGQPGTPVDQQLISLLAERYNRPGQPTLALFAENLSDTGPVPLASGAGTGGNLLRWTQAGGTTMMQALDSWLQHRSDRDPQLMSLNPATGIQLGYDNYGTRFFELYVADLDGAINGAVDAAGRPLLDDLRYWNTTLVSLNSAPLAQAEAPVFAYEGWLVDLRCIASDPDGDPLSYAWTQTTGKDVTLTGATTPNASFTVPPLSVTTDGTLTFQVTVSDGRGGNVSAGITLNAYRMGDITHDNYVNVGDLQVLVAAWDRHAIGLPADLNNDGYVNVGDLQSLVANW